jgi:Dolichyl-phosphate-mannose-protein mannosyltransferase
LVSGDGAEAPEARVGWPRSLGLGWAQLLTALAVGALFAVVAVIVLSRSATRLAGTNGVANLQWVVELQPGQKACQTTVLLPKDSAGARVFVGTFGRPGPRLVVTVATSSGVIVRRGRLTGGYADSRWQVVPFRPTETSSRGDTLCISSAGSRVALAGVADPNADNRSLLLVGGRQFPADVSLQTVRPGRESLLGLVPTIFHRAALFRPSWVGAWTYYALFALLLLTIGAAVAALIALGGGRIGFRGALVTAVSVAFVNAVIWSLVMPAFNPPDEASHYAYVASLVDLGRRPYTNPALPGGSFAAQEELAIEYTALGIVQQRQAKPPWTKSAFDEWSSVNKTIKQTRAYQIGGGYNTTAAYSPFYYALETGPYAAGKNLDIFGQLWLMRLLSALLAAATAGCVFLFAREMLPMVPWVGLVAGLAVAFEPMFAQIGGAVNNDNLLILCASLALYLLAMILRRGLTLGGALAVGAALGAGILAKPTMYALVPVALAVVVFVVLRDRPRGAGYRSLAAGAAALGALLLLDYLAFSGGSDVSTLGQTGGGGHGFQVREFLSYLWQWYLPRLPFMHDFATGIPAYDVYFKGFFAAFGHLETTFPRWVYGVLAAVSVLLLVLVAVTVYRAREQARAVLPRLGLALASLAAVALLVNVRSYLALIQANQPFAQGRYLLMTIGVFGVAVAAAAKAFGVRRGIIAGTAIVVAIACFNVFSIGLVLTRYYT